jgi:hypothetical protein
MSCPLGLTHCRNKVSSAVAKRVEMLLLAGLVSCFSGTLDVIVVEKEDEEDEANASRRLYERSKHG